VSSLQPAAVLLHAGLVWIADLKNNRILTAAAPAVH
jgi:hypothetical protein